MFRGIVIFMLVHLLYYSIFNGLFHRYYIDESLNEAFRSLLFVFDMLLVVFPLFILSSLSNQTILPRVVTGKSVKLSCFRLSLDFLFMCTYLKMTYLPW